MTPSSIDSGASSIPFYSSSMSQQRSASSESCDLNDVICKTCEPSSLEHHWDRRARLRRGPWPPARLRSAVVGRRDGPAVSQPSVSTYVSAGIGSTRVFDGGDAVTSARHLQIQTHRWSMTTHVQNSRCGAGTERSCPQADRTVNGADHCAWQEPTFYTTGATRRSLRVHRPTSYGGCDDRNPSVQHRRYRRPTRRLAPTHRGDALAHQGARRRPIAGRAAGDDAGNRPLLGERV